MKNLKFIPAVLCSISLIFSACEKEEFKTEEEANPQEFRVSMTDAPGDYEALVVEIEAVEIYNESEGWITLNNETQFVSVLDLTNGIETQLALKQDVAIGTYSKVKIKFGNTHTITLQSSLEIDGVTSTTTATFDIVIPGDHEYELAINEEINTDQGADLLIDFDVAESVIKIGEAYILKPALSIIKDRATGISGEVKGAASAAVILTDGQDSVSTYTNAEGEFLIRGMEEGTYTMTIYPERDKEGQELAEKRIEGVVVKEGKIRSAGTIRF